MIMQPQQQRLAVIPERGLWFRPCLNQLTVFFGKVWPVTEELAKVVTGAATEVEAVTKTEGLG